MDKHVLVVGAGPVGLSLSLELGRHGISCRTIDQNEGPSAWSKAQIVHARTLEVMSDMGVVDAVIAQGRTVHGFNMYEPGDCRRIVHFSFQAVDSPYPFMV